MSSFWKTCATMIGERAAELVRAGVPRPEEEVAPIAG
jgi:hypothetical protein